MVVYTAKYVPSFQYVFIKWFIKFTISPCPWVLVQSVPSFSTPGRTATLRRQTAAVPLVSYDDQQLAMTTTSQGGSAGLQQQHPLTVGKYPAAGVCGGGVPDMKAINFAVAIVRVKALEYSRETTDSVSTAR